MIPLADAELEQIAAKHVRNTSGTLCALREAARRQREVIADELRREAGRPELTEATANLFAVVAEMVAPQRRARSHDSRPAE